MKKTAQYFFTLCFTLMLFASPVLANTIEDKVEALPEFIDKEKFKDMPAESQEKFFEWNERLTEIKAMDKDDLDRSEKRELRREVKDIEKAMKAEAVSGGVYIGGTALIVILLLILLL
ncbi:hypothetical protein AB9P05_06770 [Roseivirga sp. BDSF3-8]|uniref:hypothetical protein n=1 Tax=Roseivirga sp. BDSF3-8 TaxID=3241598 RepID=UPI00353241F7